jgi:hypothetical protein
MHSLHNNCESIKEFSNHPKDIKTTKMSLYEKDELNYTQEIFSHEQIIEKIKIYKFFSSINDTVNVTAASK